MRCAASEIRDGSIDILQFSPTVRMERTAALRPSVPPVTSEANATTSPPSPVVNRHLPHVGLAMVVLAWGCGPVVAKLITAPPLVGTVIRFGISFPVLFALVHLRGRRVSVATMRRAALPGLAFGTNLIFVFYTVQEATVAVLAVAVTLQPALILIIVGPMFGERPTKAHMAWTTLGVLGASGVILGAGGSLQTSGVGLIYAALSVGGFTVYFVLSRLARSKHQVDPVEWMAAINVWSFLAGVVPVLLLTDLSDFGQVGGLDWLWLAVMAYFTGAFGHVVMSWVHGYVDAARSSLAILTMNIIAVSLAWPVHDEPVTWMQACSGLVVLLAVASALRIPPAVTAGPSPDSRRT